ncbi:MAG: hypothetical protein EAX90_02890 [Candidatus Heimdallarchaeota archaeon]|nr:hypothetical protein [Candidatus Heimdallarchaeota archaeon]
MLQNIKGYNLDNKISLMFFCDNNDLFLIIMKNLEEICLEIDALISQLGGYWSEEWLIQPVIEELGEFSKELQIKAGLHPTKRTSLEKIEEEFGDLLFAVLAMGRGLNINIEHALMTSIKKYSKRNKRE